MKQGDPIRIEDDEGLYDQMTGTVVKVLELAVIVDIEFGETFGGPHRVMFRKYQVNPLEEDE